MPGYACLGFQAVNRGLRQRLAKELGFDRDQGYRVYVGVAVVMLGVPLTLTCGPDPLRAAALASQEESQTAWKEMYKVFNMGHRMEVYLAPEHAQRVIDISKSFGVDAQIVGHVEASSDARVTVKSDKGTFEYLKGVDC